MKPDTDFSRKPSISNAQTARLVGVSVDALERLTRLGVLNPARTPTGRYLYSLADVKKAVRYFAARRRAEERRIAKRREVERTTAARREAEANG